MTRDQIITAIIGALDKSERHTFESRAEKILEAIAPALAAEYARGREDGLIEAREIVGDLPLNNEDGVIINDMKIERDCEAIRALDARVSALKGGET